MEVAGVLETPLNPTFSPVRSKLPFPLKWLICGRVWRAFKNYHAFAFPPLLPSAQLSHTRA